MSLVDQINALDPSIKTLGEVVTAVLSGWGAIAGRAWHRERRARAKQTADGMRFDNAEGANARLYDWMKGQISDERNARHQLERRVTVCESERADLRADVAALKAWVRDAKKALAAEGKRMPDPSLISPTMLSGDDPPG